MGSTTLIFTLRSPRFPLTISSFTFAHALISPLVTSHYFFFDLALFLLHLTRLAPWQSHRFFFFNTVLPPFFYIHYSITFSYTFILIITQPSHMTRPNGALNILIYGVKILLQMIKP